MKILLNKQRPTVDSFNGKLEDQREDYNKLKRIAESVNCNVIDDDIYDKYVTFHVDDLRAQLDGVADDQLLVMKNKKHEAEELAGLLVSVKNIELLNDPELLTKYHEENSYSYATTKEEIDVFKEIKSVIKSMEKLEYKDHEIDTFFYKFGYSNYDKSFNYNFFEGVKGVKESKEYKDHIKKLEKV